MHTVELLDEAIGLAERLGYHVRTEWLAGCIGGGCEFGGHKWIFLDVTLGPLEQLEMVLEALRRDPEALAYPMPYRLRDLLAIRKSA
jgi:predicted alternative tryptophan synthase beta-subunit